MTTRPNIYLVDDDKEFRDSLELLLHSAGYAVRTHGSAKAFLSDAIEAGSCLIADIRLPEMDGVQLLVETGERGLDLAVIMITGNSDVALAVRAMKAGAIDFIEKPFENETIMASIEKALDISSRRQSLIAEGQAAQELLRLLTRRELSVLEKLVAGRSNKIAAFELGISPRTIEIHRSHIMDKVRARSLSDLVRIAIAAERHSGRP